MVASLEARLSFLARVKFLFLFFPHPYTLEEFLKRKTTTVAL